MRPATNRAIEIPEDIKRIVGRVETALRVMKVDIVTPAPAVNDVERRLTPHLNNIEAQLRMIVVAAEKLKGK